MRLCPYCGVEVLGDDGVCAHHAAVHGDEWHVSNRVMCDLLHRGIVPERLPEPQRADEYVHVETF